jgi:hypothetical protein
MLSLCLRRIRSEDFYLCFGEFLHAGIQKSTDLFIYAFNTINYLLQPEQVIQHLQLCSANLTEHGSIFIDALVPFAMTKTEESGDRLRRTLTLSDGCTYELWDRRTYDPASQVEERHLKSLEIRDDKVVATLRFKTWRRYHSVQEIEDYAAKAGLRIALVEPYYVADCLDGHFFWLERDPETGRTDTAMARCTTGSRNE